MNKRTVLSSVLSLGLLVMLCASVPVRAQEGVLEATTASGEKVRLLPNGRWEYVEQKKAEVQREQRRVEDAREAGAQGGFLGLGRKVYEGDKDYNRGSLNPKMR